MFRATVSVDGLIQADVMGGNLHLVVAEGQHYFTQYLEDYDMYNQDVIELKIERLDNEQAGGE